MSIINELQRKSSFISYDPADDDDIEAAETAISVRFADDYKEYIKAMGFAVYEGHELTGICKSERLSVIDVTLSERKDSCDECKEWYVVEQIHMDGIVIWQSSTGKVYRTLFGQMPLKICDSLLEYINL